MMVCFICAARKSFSGYYFMSKFDMATIEETIKT